MTQPMVLAYQWMRQRFEDNRGNRKLTAPEDHDVDAVVSDEPAKATAQHDKPHDKPKRR